MSTKARQFKLHILLLLTALLFVSGAAAQRIAVSIEVDATGRRATVKGRFEDGFRPEAGRDVAFRRSVAGNDELAKRIGALSLRSAGGDTVEAVRTLPHRFAASGEYAGFEYTVDLAPAADRRAAAHASWMTADGGVLMLDDLLPLFGGDRKRQRAIVSLRLPKGWKSYSADGRNAEELFDVRDIEGSVIFAGTRFREIPVRSHAGSISLLTDGAWNFSDAEASKAAAEIYDAYTKKLGWLPTERSLVALIKFPRAESPGVWEAETRGAAVVIVSSDVPFKDRSLQRMHEQLRHEIFHLWFPNAVELTGDYAWFYEGAALYESLKLGVATGQLKFENYLDTLLRAYEIDSSAKVRKPLVGAGSSEVYARGMLIAFLLDIRLMAARNGGLAAELSRMMDKHKRPSGPVSAESVLLSLAGAPHMIERYVVGADPIDWAEELSAAGLKLENRNGRRGLAVEDRINGSQKAILKRLGYN